MIGERKRIYNSIKFIEIKERAYNLSDKTCVCCKKYTNFEDMLLQVKKDNITDSSKSIENYKYDDLEFYCQKCYKADLNTNDPQSGWSLLHVVDNMEVSYHCERIKDNNVRCNTPIRYEHNIFHPEIGYRIVGSTCITHLTEEDQAISRDVIQAMPRLFNRAEKVKNMEKLNNWKYLNPYGDQVYSFHLEIDGVHYYMYVIDEGKDKFSLQINRNYVFMTFKNARDRENTKLFTSKDKIFAISTLFESYFKAQKSKKPHLVNLYGDEIKLHLKKIGYKFGKTIDKRKPKIKYQ